MILGLVAQGQIVVKYQQGFESTGETCSYTTSGSAAPQTSFASSGNRALKLSHTQNNQSIVVLDTIDFTDNSSLQYYVLEFMHGCDVDPTTLGAGNQGYCAIIEAKRIDQTGFTQLTGNSHYDMTWGGGSSSFASLSSFSSQSYTAWQTGSMSNTWWKKEKFNLNSFFMGTYLADRKLVIRFVLQPRVSTGTTNQGWYIDGITVKASTQSMATPTITMASYPDLVAYPTSRSVRIDADITTTAAAGMCNDSVYILYRLGVNGATIRQTMSPVAGAANRYRAYIPFCGYDTVVHYKLVAKDATLNHNTSTFPTDESAWEEYHCVRGYSAYSDLSWGTEAVESGDANYPFPFDCSSRSQFVFDSSTMAAAGYKAGSITGFTFTCGSNVSNSEHNRFQIKMCNVDPSLIVSTSNTASNVKYYTGAMKVVYDSALTLNMMSGQIGSINFQDTFFYAGKDLIVTVTFKHTSNPPALKVKAFNAASQKQTIYTHYGTAYNFDPFSNALFTGGSLSTKRPNFRFRQLANMPLLYDCGIAGYITPNDSTSADATTSNNVVLVLKNYGSNTINNVKIWYQLDGGVPQSYDWSGTLQGGATTNVTVTSTQTYTPGYHEMLAWVDDSVTSNGSRYRDHEPNNDTLWTKFVACTGPMSGNVTVGGPNDDYTSMDRFLYSLNQCGVGGPLHVKLAAGTYAPIVMPSVPGTSASNFVQFEPAVAGSTVEFSASAANRTGTLNAVVNLQSSNHIRFSHIRFTCGITVSSSATYLVRMGLNSTGCQFLNCEFSETTQAGAPSNSAFASALIYSGGADSIVVDGCSFSRGVIGVSLVGPAADNLAHGSTISRCHFVNQQNNAAVVRNQVAAIVDSNTVDNLLTGASYALLFQDCHGATKVTRNTVYITSGASCLGVTEFFGTESQIAIIANNMLIVEDQGTTDVLTPPLNFITAEYTKVVYNSVKLTAPLQVNTAAATFGGGTINHCYFFNNIASCFDTTNFAFDYIPNAGNVNYIGYNIYYSQGQLLNRYDGVNCTSMSAWQSHIADGNSQFVNPSFLNSTLTDLRSYSQNVKNHGAVIPEVTNDIYGNVRDSVSPCVGAFEFAALPYDFEVIGMVEPYDEYCNVPTSVPLRVMIKNSGVNTFTPGVSGTLTLNYARKTFAGNTSGANAGSVPVNITIPGSSTVVFNTGATVQIPTNGLLDTTYQFYFWLTASAMLDPNPINDTSHFETTARYHAPAPTAINDNINYATADTITVTAGLQSWNANVFPNGRIENSTVYWYTDSLPTTAPFFRGNTYITPILYQDTTFYIRQKRDMAMMRITEVQLKNSGVGVTYPQQLWMNSATAFAIELTNVGDAPANMEGDTLMMISPTSSMNNKIYVFPNVTIQPGQSIVIQRASGNTPDSTKTLFTTIFTAPTVNATTKFALLYRDKKGVVDAVSFNDFSSTTTGTAWSSQNIPSAVWTGSGIPLTTTTVGAYRKHWTSQAGATADSWQVADSAHTMTLGTPNANLIRFTDNGCLGDVAPVHIHLNMLPQVDLSIDSLVMPSGCGLGVEPVTIPIKNFGINPSGVVVAYYSINDSLVCVDTIAAGVPSLTTIQHTFSTSANMYVPSGSKTFVFKAWVGHVLGDNAMFNDTASVTVVSSHAPNAPIVMPYDTVQYATRATLTALGVISDSLAWYDHDMNPLDTTNVFVSDYLYVTDSFYVTAFGHVEDLYHVGDLANVNAVGSYPSPYNPKKRYGREQYIITAAEMMAAGHSAGPITSIAFYLDSIPGTGTMTFDGFTVSIGTTSQATFTSNTNWMTLSEKYTTSSLTLTNADKGWVRHEFTSPFIWDGTSNIVVGITRSLPALINSGAQTRYTAAAANTVLFKDDAQESIIGNTPPSGGRSANRPDIQFGFDGYGCEGPASKIVVVVEGTPACDASLEWPESYDTISFSSCGANNFDVTVHNGGSSSVTNYTVDYWVDAVHGTYTGTDELPSNTSVVKTIATPSLTPGRHTLMAVVNAASDTIHVNDTIRRIINVSFCAGTYTIGAAASNDYPNFSTAIDTLNGAGIAGPVVFLVQDGTYNEQVRLASIKGVSMTNTLTFRSASGNADAVILRYACTTTDNYVLCLDSISDVNFEHITIYGAGSNTASNAVMVANASNIHFTSDVIRVKGSVNISSVNSYKNASCINVYEGVQNLYLDSCVLDSGYYSVVSTVSARGLTSGMIFNDNTFSNFMYQAINLRKVDEVYIKRNTIRSGVGANAKPLTGISVAELVGGVDIERNNIVLYDAKTGGKRDIVLVDCKGSNTIRGKIYNNMCVAHSTGVNGQVPTGIFIDSSEYVNVYYNSVRVFAGVSAPTTMAFSANTTSTNLFVLNNIFANFSRGYAYWMYNLANVALSNYNVYFSDTAVAVNNRKLVHIGPTSNTVGELKTLDTLRYTNGQDVNSLFNMPYFHADDDLHLEFGLYTEKAQYRTEVPNDIDGDIRPQIPQPTIGADEYIRDYHNIAVMQIMEPTLDSNTVEADSLRVVVKLYNDGKSTEANLYWYAQIRGTQLRTPNRSIDEIQPTEVIFDTAYIQLPMGLIDTQYIEAFFPLANDAVPTNNITDTVFFLEMAYNLKAEAVEANIGDGCRLYNTPISITVRNVGRKPIPPTYPVTIGYEVQLSNANSNAGVNMNPQLPIEHEEQVFLPDTLAVDAPHVFTFAQLANLYPTNNDKDITLKMRGWLHYEFDQKPLAPGNDSTGAYNQVNTNKWTQVVSKYTPHMPEGVDLTLNYATWDTIFATQTDNPPTASGSTVSHRPIRWYRDSTDAEPFYAPTAYGRAPYASGTNQKGWWEPPYMYFHDTVYYLSCISTTGCTSYYNPVYVHVLPRVTTDAAVVAIEAPYSKVFQTNENRDSVKVRIINYGAQNITDIPVTYQFRRVGNNQPVLQEVTEVCHAVIAPDSTYLFTFDSLVMMPVENVDYSIRAWTNMATEQVRLNDTLRELRVFKPLPENTYCTPVLDAPDGMDIVHVSFSSLNNDVPEVGRDYVNFGNYNNPDVEPLRLIKGTTDTMIITVANSDNHGDFTTGGFVTVFIDYNRDGVFQDANPLEMQPGDTTEIIFGDTLVSNRPKKFVFTLPDDICLGYMRMRVVAEQNGNTYASRCPEFSFGQVQDYLLYIEDVPEATDVALSRVVTPATPFIDRDSTVISFMMSNKGSSTIENAEIGYRVVRDSFHDSIITWTGSLLPGQSTLVSLPAMHMEEGTTTFRIYVHVDGDTNNANDTIKYQCHRFQVRTLILKDNFEDPSILWYNPMGYNKYSQNVWEKGFPSKTNLFACVSDSNVWTTRLGETMAHGQRGNLSYLYSPIIDISQIRPDTISFMLASALGDSSTVYVEYYNYLGHWVKLGNGNDSLWYTGGAGFKGSTPGHSYEYFRFPTSKVSGEFQQRLQFRFVYHARPGAAPTDGVAIDSVVIGRAQRAVDVGVTSIPHPVHPKFGQTVYPKVVIHNYGYDTAYSVNLAYRPYGTNLAKTATYHGAIAPGEADLFAFPDGFIITKDFPDTFQICAYTTVNLDIYWENDSTCKDFYLSPLDNDMGMVEFLYPRDRIVAGDSITVTTRIRNYGQAPVNSATVTYVFNNSYTVTETVDFQEVLNRGLESFEYYNYTFRQKCRASMGIMHMTAYVTMEGDDYIYNDTIRKTIDGISAITDLYAREIVVDTNDHNFTRIQLAIDNVGARAANNFEVGYWYDKDTSTLVRETFNRSVPLAALASTYYTFDSVLPNRAYPNGYFYVTAYVHFEGDNDYTNDTTSIIVGQYVDLQARKVLIQENREEDCHVRLEIENVGNTATDPGQMITISAVVNGVSIKTNLSQRINPGEVYHLDFNKTVPKNNNRQYQGTGSISTLADGNAVNNQTSVVEVINYFDDIPLVSAANGMVLDQNFPNPFSSDTRIDFHIPSSGDVSFFVMDAMGRLVYQSSESYEAGDHSINFSQTTLSTGVYYYGIEMNGDRLMRKMVYKK